MDSVLAGRLAPLQVSVTAEKLPVCAIYPALRAASRSISRTSRWSRSRRGRSRQASISQRIDKGPHPGRHLGTGRENGPYPNFQRFDVGEDDPL